MNYDEAIKVMNTLIIGVLPISNKTFYDYLFSYQACQNSILDEVVKGNMSKEHYMIDYVYDDKDRYTIMRVYNELFPQLNEFLETAKKEHAELSAIKQVVDNWDEGEYYTDSICSMKKIQDIIKGESK